MGQTQKTQERPSAPPLPPPPPKLVNCSICNVNDITENEEAVTGNCKHKRTVCDSCMARYISEEVTGKGNVADMECLEDGCKAKLDFNDVKRFATKDVFERFDTITTRRCLESMDGFAWCAHGCGCGQIHSNPTYNIMRCHGCKKKTCFKHKCVWHEGRTCGQYDEDAKASDEVALLQYLESNGVRCPKCKHGIEKSSGCDHMTCKKNVGGCGAEFCYRCGADYNGDKGIRKVGNKAHKSTCTYHA